MKISRPQYGVEQQIVEAIYLLKQKKSSQLFREPVNRINVPDYYEVIKNPMDLSTILNKLKGGEYDCADSVYKDLQLIVTNCNTYNRLDQVLKKGEQFRDCIKTVWGNFKKELQKKGHDYNQSLTINDEILKRIAAIEEKKNKKKIPALQAVIQQQKKNILPEANMLLPMMQVQKVERDELPPELQFNPHKYAGMDKEQKKRIWTFDLDEALILEEFEKIAERKLIKYKKILKKKLLWFDQKIIQKCLTRKSFEKMQVPRHLNAYIEGGAIAEELNIRKLQLYVKKITYWVQDNSNILSDYMKDKFVQNCRAMKRCIIRVIKYKKTQRTKAFVDGRNELGIDINLQQKEDDNYENKMKDFKKILDKDRQKSTKRDTKIILRNQNGVMQVYDWTSQSKQMRGTRKDGGGTVRIEHVDIDQKKKQEERKRQQLRIDEQFMHSYSKKSNVLLIGKYGSRLAINWQNIRERSFDAQKQITQIRLDSTDIQF